MDLSAKNVYTAYIHTYQLIKNVDIALFVVILVMKTKNKNINSPEMGELFNCSYINISHRMGPRINYQEFPE